MAAPVNSVLPAITGTVEVGQTLTVSQGTWTGADSYAYSWTRDGVLIPGATAATHVITRSDLLTVLVGRVTATNIDGNTIADSAGTTPVPSTLIVEDGTQVAGADSYVSLVEIALYHSKNSNAAWAAATPEAQESAARSSTRYVDGNYRLRLKGQKVYPLTQSLEWPRVGVRVVDPQLYYDVPASFYDSQYSGFIGITTIPQRLKDAQCELALNALAGDLSTSVDVSIKRRKIDVLETEYFQGITPGQASYPVVDQLLSDYLKPVGSQDVQRG